jgi:protein-disulfide isomerase
MKPTLQVPAHGKDHRIGLLEAPIVVIEYGDYECPLSAKANHWMNEILKEFKSDICYVFRHFPFTDIHPHSALAAIAAEAAAKEHRFWEMHNLLMENYKILSGKKIVEMSREINLEMEDFLLSLESDDLMDNVCKDIVSGEESGVHSTPSFFVNNILLEGPTNYHSLREEIVQNLNHLSLR